MSAASAEGIHVGRPWVLTPAGEDGTRVELRLFEPVGQDTRGEPGVLLSVTERRLADDHDPLTELREDPAPATFAALADFSASAGLSAQEAGRLFEQLVAFTAACTRPQHGENRADH